MWKHRCEWSGCQHDGTHQVLWATSPEGPVRYLITRPNCKYHADVTADRLTNEGATIVDVLEIPRSTASL